MFTNMNLFRCPRHFRMVWKSLVQRQSSDIAAVLAEQNVQRYLDKVQKNLMGQERSQSLMSGLGSLLTSRETLKTHMASLSEIEGTKDEELRKMLEEENDQYKKQLAEIEVQILEGLCQRNHISCNGLILEITAGVGGQEAMLFAKDLYRMYCGYIDYKDWSHLIVELNDSDLGGIRGVSIAIEGQEAFYCLRHEAGVHRVQRVPSTEKSGRVHTSTATVAVLPQPSEVDVILKEKDLIVETKRASGAGGQHVNTTDSAVRITHIPSKIVVECQVDRSQVKNRQLALSKLRAKLYQTQIEERETQQRKMRKTQVGSSARSDKVRTYNFNQDRITDHRLMKNYHHITEFLDGGNDLDDLIQDLVSLSKEESFNSFIELVRAEGEQ